MNVFMKYSNLHFKKLELHLEEYKNLPVEDTLHKIRLELKMLKVLFHLIEYCDKDFKASKEFQFLHIIFHKAGQIREIDVLERLMVKYNIENANVIPKGKNKMKLINEFIKKIPQFQKIVVNDRKHLSKHLLKIAKFKRKKLRKELFPKINLRKLHVIRKKIKENVYLFDILNGEKKNLQGLRDLENVIGDWHDKQMVIEILKDDKITKAFLLLKNIKSERQKDIKMIKAMVGNSSFQFQKCSIKNLDSLK
jgi:CHAD domain-containing protein